MIIGDGGEDGWFLMPKEVEKITEGKNYIELARPRIEKNYGESIEFIQVFMGNSSERFWRIKWFMPGYKSGRAWEVFPKKRKIEENIFLTKGEIASGRF